MSALLPILHIALADGRQQGRKLGLGETVFLAEGAENGLPVGRGDCH